MSKMFSDKRQGIRNIKIVTYTISTIKNNNG